jgi:hypothetical protein
MILTQFQCADPFRIDVQHHSLLIPAVQGLHQERSRLAAAGDQMKRLAQMPDPGRKPVAPGGSQQGVSCNRPRMLPML